MCPVILVYIRPSELVLRKWLTLMSLKSKVEVAKRVIEGVLFSVTIS